MASCNTNDLLRSGRLFQQLGGGLSQVARLALWKNILLAISPGADTSANTLLSSGKCFTCLTPGQQRIVKMQLLCEILAELGSTPPVPFVPTDIPGMVVWLDASTMGLGQGDDVHIWQDSSGNGNDFGDVVDTPTYDTTTFPQGAVVFENVFLQCVDSLAPQPFSLFFVMMLNNNGGDNAVLGSDVTLFYHSAGSPSLHSFGLFTDGADAWTDGTGGNVVAVKCSIGVTTQGVAAPKFYRQGVLQTNNLSSNNGTGYNDTAPTIGAFPANSPSIQGSFVLAEMVMYDHVITAAEIVQLQNYWTTKWGI